MCPALLVEGLGDVDKHQNKQTSVFEEKTTKSDFLERLVFFKRKVWSPARSLGLPPDSTDDLWSIAMIIMIKLPLYPCDHLPLSPWDHLDHLPHEARTPSCNQHWCGAQNNNQSHGEWAHGTWFPIIWSTQKKTFDLLWSSFAGLCCQAQTSYYMYNAPVERRLCSKYFFIFDQCPCLMSGKSHYCLKCLRKQTIVVHSNQACGNIMGTKPMAT